MLREVSNVTRYFIRLFSRYIVFWWVLRENMKQFRYMQAKVILGKIS